MCTYKEKKSEPSEMMQLDGYTVDYIEAASGNEFKVLSEKFIYIKVKFLLFHISRPHGGHGFRRWQVFL